MLTVLQAEACKPKSSFEVSMPPNDSLPILFQVLEDELGVQALAYCVHSLATVFM